MHLLQALFPIHRSERYFQLFGRAGFHEHQSLIPKDKISAYFDELCAISKRTGQPIILCSSKSFGGTDGNLRYGGPGISVAVNIAAKRNALQVMSALDELVIKLGGRPNIIKDSRLPLSVVQQAYPDYDRFKTRLQSYDSKRLFQSALTQRLDL